MYPFILDFFPENEGIVQEELLLLFTVDISCKHLDHSLKSFWTRGIHSGVSSDWKPLS